jgi:diguanylate cyclase (GGDEF)-like protein/PAS domain S-box-containing protein
MHREGYATVSAENGEAALVAVAQSPPDLILLDLKMPGMDGCQVAKILKLQPATANIPIIILTALGDERTRLAGLHAGAEDFLAKPFRETELRLRVRNLLRLKADSDSLKSRSESLEQQVQERAADLYRFRTAMDATADAIVLVNRGTMGFVEANASACRMLGYTHEELIELDPASVTGATRAGLEASYDAIIAGSTASEPTEIELRRKDGTVVLVEAQLQAHRSGEDWIIVGVMRDISARKEAESRLHRLAHYDALTGLPNRTLFHENLRKALVHADGKGWRVALLYLDLDNFKGVNDTLGHGIGDQLLGQFSNCLSQCVRIRDTVGRLGGDEFGLMLVLEEGKQGATIVANKIREALHVPFSLSNHEVTVTASLGIAFYPDDARDPDTLMKYADTAMYQAKQAGRDTYRYFTAQMNTEVVARLDLEASLRRAIEKDEFVLHYQPKVELSSGRITGVEALIRWNRPGAGLVSPTDFIPMLEETGLIARVGRWVIATACRQIGLWLRSAAGPVQVSVNVAGRQMVECDLYDDVVKALRENDIPAYLLELELTESTLMANTDRTVTCLKQLKALGVRISIDDFGTGYSSLAYLRRFPIDRLKIDMSFIRDVTSNPDDAAIVLAIIHMAHRLNLDTVAEGVETEAQVAYLRRHCCGHIQGFYFSAAIAPPAFEQMLRAETRLLAPSDADDMTLLVVDDEERVVRALVALLRSDGYRILTATSAEEGFEQLALHHVDVLMCDERMPVMSGTDFLDRVKDLYPDTFRIVLSGQADPGGIMAAINRGSVQRFYAKPWDNRTLRESIGEAFRQGGRQKYARDMHEEALVLDFPAPAAGRVGARESAGSAGSNGSGAARGRRRSDATA